MTNLPISVNSNNKPASPPSGSNAAAEPQGTQEFGNVLAQQMAGAEQAAGKQEKSAKSTAQQLEENRDDVAAASAVSAENPALISAEILASLLGQQAAITQNGDDAAQNMEASLPAMRKTAHAEQLAAAKPGSDKGVLPDILSDMQATSQPGSLQELMQRALPEVQTAGNTAPLSSTIPAGKPGAGTSVMPDILSGMQTTTQPGSSQGVIQGMLPAAQLATGAAIEIIKDQAMSQRSPAELIQSAQTATVPGELITANMQSLQSTHSNSPNLSTHFASPLHHPAWPDELGQKVSWIATQQNQSAELHLNPPQLGPLDITLKMTGDQASAHFSSPHAAVREAIENALPRLREILADNGITLGQAMVSDQSAQHNRDKAAQTGNKRLDADSSMENTPVITTSLPPVRRHHGMVDTFV